jgi:hypothetical protein
MSATSILIMLLSHAPELFTDGEALWASVAKGEGGVQKIETALANLSTLVTHANQALQATK